jgi:hypothetical protein
MRKFLALALMAVALAIAMVATVQANTVIDQNSAAMTMTAVPTIQDDVGAAVVIQNTIFSETQNNRMQHNAQFAPANNWISRFDSMRGINTVQLGDTQAARNCAYLSVYASTNSGQLMSSLCSAEYTFQAMICNGEKSGNVGHVLKCPQVAEVTITMTDILFAMNSGSVLRNKSSTVNHRNILRVA